MMERLQRAAYGWRMEMARHNRQAIQLFTSSLSFHVAVLAFDQAFQPLILQAPATWHNYS